LLNSEFIGSTERRFRTDFAGASSVFFLRFAALSGGSALFVLPERPAGSEKLGEEELAGLVTRDAMVGVAKVNLPQPGANL